MHDFAILHHADDRPWALWLVWILRLGGFAATALRVGHQPLHDGLARRFVHVTGATPVDDMQLAPLSGDPIRVVVDGGGCTGAEGAAYAGCLNIGSLPPREAREAFMARMLAEGISPTGGGVHPVAADPDTSNASNTPDVRGGSGAVSDGILAPPYPGAARISNINTEPHLPSHLLDPLPDTMAQGSHFLHATTGHATTGHATTGHAFGRTPLRRRIAKATQQSTTAGSSAPVVLHGPGGSGKSYLAREAAASATPDYRVVWWLRGSSQATLTEDFAALADELALVPHASTDVNRKIDATLGALQHRDDWLLVFDDVPDPAAVESFVPPAASSAGGNVLVTTRREPPSHHDDSAHWLHVGPLEREESLSALTSAAKDHPGAMPSHGPALAEQLDDSPLAVVLAASLLEITRISSDGLMAALQATSTTSGSSGTSACPAHMAACMGPLYAMHLAHLADSAPHAAHLLQVAAWLHPDSIPASLLAGRAALLGAPLGPRLRGRGLEESVHELVRRALVIPTSEGFALQPGLAEAVRRQLDADPETSATRLGEALALLLDAYPAENINARYWSISSRLLPHALAVAAHARDAEVHADHAAELYNRVGLYLLGAAEYSHARTLFQTALALDEARHGADSPHIAARLRNIAGMAAKLGDLDSARHYYERSLAIAEGRYGPTDPRLSGALVGLGRTLRELGRMDEAARHLGRALELERSATRTAVPAHPDAPAALHPSPSGSRGTLAIRLQDYGEVLLQLGEPAAAHDLLAEALTITNADYGAAHPLTARARARLAGVLVQLAALQPHDASTLLARARELLDQSYSVFLSRFGPSHAETACALVRLGELALAEGDRRGARDTLRRALDTFDVLGEEAALEHSREDGLDMVALLTTLAQLEHSLGDTQGGLARLQRAHHMARARLGDQHPRTRQLAATRKRLEKGTPRNAWGQPL